MQMLPNDVVMERRYDPPTALEQQPQRDADDEVPPSSFSPVASADGTNHQVPTVPATVTCTTFLITWNTQ